MAGMGADTPAAACPAGRMIGRRTKPAPNPTISATSTMVTVLPCVMPAPFRVMVVVRRELLIGFLRIGYVDACPIRRSAPRAPCHDTRGARSEEHTSALQSLMRISYAVFCLKKNTTENNYIIRISYHVIKI